MTTQEQRKTYYEKNKKRICNYYKMKYLQKKLQIEKTKKEENNKKTEEIKFTITLGSFIISFD